MIMQKVIDIPQEVIEKDAEGYFNYFGCMSTTLYQTLKNGTVLSDNPTNGDMIKAMFPAADIATNDKLGEEGTVFVHHKDHIIIFDLDWWNAPYREEKE